MKIVSLLLLVLLTISPAWAQGTRFGTNVEPPNYYDTSAPYVDILMRAEPWWGPGSTQLSPTGYPAVIGQGAQSQVRTQGYPTGIYNFYGEGDFTIGLLSPDVGNQTTSPPGFIPGTFKKVGNIATGQVQINSPAINASDVGEIVIDIYAKDANNLPNNFHLTRPEYPAWPNTNATFGREYLQALSPFCALRFMDWMGTNGTTVTNWASRPQPTIFGYKNQGNCYERMIELSNTTGTDMWICVPLNATDDWASNMAQLVKQNLNPNLHCYYEMSNEMWNWNFPQWQQVETWDKTNPALTTNSAWARHGQEMAYLLMHFASIMQPILSSQGRPILAGQMANTIYCSSGLQWIQQTYGAPSKYIYGIAGAPYFAINSTSLAVTGLDSLMASMTDYVNNYVTSWISPNMASSNQYGVKLLCHAMRQGSVAAPTTMTLYQSAQYDPRMGTLYTNECNMLKSAGADLCCFYNFCTGDSKYGFWGALQDIRQISNPPIKYATQASIATSCNCGNGLVGWSKK